MGLGALKRGEALERLHICLSENGTIRWGPHFSKALAEEGLTFPVAWHVMRAGSIYEAPEFDIKNGEWKYRVEGHAPDGIWLVIVFSLKETNSAFLITAFSLESPRRGGSHAKKPMR